MCFWKCFCVWFKKQKQPRLIKHTLFCKNKTPKALEGEKPPKGEGGIESPLKEKGRALGATVRWTFWPKEIVFCFFSINFLFFMILQFLIIYIIAFP